MKKILAVVTILSIFALVGCKSSIEQEAEVSVLGIEAYTSNDSEELMFQSSNYLMPLSTAKSFRQETLDSNSFQQLTSDNASNTDEDLPTYTIDSIVTLKIF